MKKIIPYLLFVTLVLAACSTARPVMRSKETNLIQTTAQEEIESSEPEAGIALSPAQSSTSETADTKIETSTKPNAQSNSNAQSNPKQDPKEVTKSTKAEQSTQSDEMISASEKDLGSSETEKTKGNQTTSSSALAPDKTADSKKDTLPGPEKLENDGLEIIEELVEHPLSKYNLFDYYPLIPNRRTDLSGGDFGDSSLVLQYLFEEHDKITAQIKQTSANGEQVNVIEVTPDKVSDLYYFVQIPYRANIMARTDYEERIILKAPLQAGTTWDSTGLKFEIITVDQPRVIKGQEMTVMDVEVSKGAEKVLFTYAVGIGLVSNDLLHPDGTKTNIVQYDGMEERITDDYNVELFFPGKDGTVKNVEAKLDFLTNESLKDRLTQVYEIQAKANDLTPVLGENIKIQYILKKPNLVHVDLNEAFITSVNQTPELESVRIQCLVDTLSSFYQVEGVTLSINDQRYESEHRKIEVGEVLTASYSDPD